MAADAAEAQTTLGAYSRRRSGSAFTLRAFTTRRRSKPAERHHTVEDVDYEQIEQAIAEEPTSPGDARIAKFIFDAGPGSAFTIYDLRGLTGKYRLSERSGRAVLTASVAQPSSSERLILVDSSEFDGSSILSGGTNQLTLSFTPVNTATTVETAISDAEDTVMTITRHLRRRHGHFILRSHLRQ